MYNNGLLLSTILWLKFRKIRNPYSKTTILTAVIVRSRFTLFIFHSLLEEYFEPECASVFTRGIKLKYFLPTSPTLPPTILNSTKMITPGMYMTGLCNDSMCETYILLIKHFKIIFFILLESTFFKLDEFSIWPFQLNRNIKLSYPIKMAQVVTGLKQDTVFVNWFVRMLWMIKNAINKYIFNQDSVQKLTVTYQVLFVSH